MRPGEIAVLRWSNYDATIEPLGKLVVAKGLNTRKMTIKGTKTNAVRKVSVHPTLAAMLAEWRLSGWERMMGRAPAPDDLILPLPPADAARRRTRTGEALRTGDYAGKKWREVDRPMLGWRHRRLYDGKSTMITLAIDDGANPDVIRQRVTHARVRRNAFDGYDRGDRWMETCTALAKLKIARKRVAATVLALRG